MEKFFNKERNHVFDALKFFAIFLVLWGHCIQYFLSSNYYDEPLYRIIYSFHMPLFMAIVGYFSKNIVSYSFGETIKKKGRQLLLPSICMGIILLLPKICIRGGGINDLKSLILSFWFLKSAFLCCLLYFVTYRLFEPNRYKYIYVGLLISLFILPYRVYLMYPCFMLGIVMNEYSYLIKKYSGVISIISGCQFLFLLLFWDSSFWKGPSMIQTIFSPNLIPEYLYNYMYRIVIGILGVIFFCSLFEYLSKRLEYNAIGKYICRWGSETLGIYLLQTYIIEILLAILCNFDDVNYFIFNFVIAPGISLIVLSICLFCIALIKKSSLFSFLLLGKKYKQKLIANSNI